MSALAVGVACSAPASILVAWCIKKCYDYYKDRTIIRAQEMLGWVHIGKVKFMCVYPVDGGREIKTNAAFFGQFGLQTYTDITDSSGKRPYYDRGFIIFNTQNRDLPRAVVDNPLVSSMSDEVEGVKLLWKYLRPLSATLTTGANMEIINYLNSGTMNLYIPRQGNLKLRAAFPFGRIHGEQLSLGYFPQDRRREFNAAAKRRLQGSAECYRSNYASFTMVNTRSIKEVRTRAGKPSLTYRNFRPQIVFSGKMPFIEDNIEFLKIGNLEFNNVNPCTHGEDINLCFDSELQRGPIISFFAGPVYTHNQRTYRYLENTRPISIVKPGIRGENTPMFGITFELADQNPIPENAEVSSLSSLPSPINDLQGDITSRNVIMEDDLVFAKYLPPVQPTYVFSEELD